MLPWISSTTASNGEAFLNRLIVAPVKDANGHCQYFVGIQKEIREDDLDSSRPIR